MSDQVEILLVEDNRTDAELVAEALKDSGLPHRLDIATDGVEALEVLKTEQDKPHIVLLDLNLPKKSGIEVLAEIKRDPNIRAIPVVILTNSESRVDVVRCYDNHCTSYIRKPLLFGDWVATLNCLTHFLLRVATLPQESPLAKHRGCLLCGPPSRRSLRPGK